MSTSAVTVIDFMQTYIHNSAELETCQVNTGGLNHRMHVSVGVQTKNNSKCQIFNLSPGTIRQHQGSSFTGRDT